MPTIVGEIVTGWSGEGEPASDGNPGIVLGERHFGVAGGRAAGLVALAKGDHSVT